MSIWTDCCQPPNRKIFLMAMSTWFHRGRKLVPAASAAPASWCPLRHPDSSCTPGSSTAAPARLPAIGLDRAGELEVVGQRIRAEQLEVVPERDPELALVAEAATPQDVLVVTLSRSSWLTPFGFRNSPQVSWMFWCIVQPPKTVPPFGSRACMLSSNPL